MRAKVNEAGLGELIEVQSAGTGDWHVGEAPDARARAAASARGIELQSVARQVQQGDFERFDLILAMDRANLRALHRLAPPPPARAELRLLREFEAREGERTRARGEEDPFEVPDPYYGEGDGFEVVLDLLEASCDGLLEELEGRLRARAHEDGGPVREAST